MVDSRRALAGRVALGALALLPWLGALYLLYVLESRGVWQAAQPWRAVTALLILAAGMALSFAFHSLLRRRR